MVFFPWHNANLFLQFSKANKVKCQQSWLSAKLTHLVRNRGIRFLHNRSLIKFDTCHANSKFKTFACFTSELVVGSVIISSLFKNHFILHMTSSFPPSNVFGTLNLCSWSSHVFYYTCANFNVAELGERFSFSTLLRFGCPSQFSTQQTSQASHKTFDQANPFQGLQSCCCCCAIDSFHSFPFIHCQEASKHGQEGAQDQV